MTHTGTFGAFGFLFSQATMWAASPFVAAGTIEDLTVTLPVYLASIGSSIACTWVIAKALHRVDKRRDRQLRRMEEMLVLCSKCQCRIAEKREQDDASGLLD